MHANSLRSPLALGLVVAVAIALPPTAGHLVLQDPRVVSDANIRLASCATGTSPGPIFGIACYSVAKLTYGDLDQGRLITLSVYGPLGGLSTLAIDIYYSAGTLSVTGSFAGPLRNADTATVASVARPTRRGAVTRSSAAAVAPPAAATHSVKDAKSDKAATTPRSAAARPHATASRAGAANAAAARPAADRRASNTRASNTTA
jgi:hypothetical protein